MRKKQLHIAMLGHKRLPSREGGIEVVVEELSTRMVQAGHEVTCYNRRGQHISGESFSSQTLDSYKGVRLLTVPTLERKGWAAMTSSVFAAVKSAFGKYDIVHFHAEGSCTMLWLPKLLGKRCIATIHGLDWQREKWRGSLASQYIRLGEWMAAKCADEIIVLSHNVQAYFLATYGRKTTLIPNGVNRPIRCDADEITERWGLEKDSYLLFLGRIVPEKGLRYLVEAYRGLRTDKKLVICGGASDTEDFMRSLREMTAEDENILFTDFVEGQTLEELYSNAYLYVLPSDVEGMALTLLEAMSYGNCCVVSDIPENVEVVADKAVIARRGDVKDLKSKLQMLCNDESMVQRYRDNAADFICEGHHWDDVVRQTIALYYGD